MKVRVLPLLLLAIALPAAAHVSVLPSESQAGAAEKYLVRVPGEGKIATAEVQLEVPVDVRVIVVGAPIGWTQDIERRDNRIVRILWRMEIKPGEFAEFPFIARNPKEGSEIVWKVRQKFADGSATDWVGTPSERNRAPVTKLR